MNKLLQQIHQLHQSVEKEWRAAQSAADCTDQIEPALDTLFNDVSKLAQRFPLHLKHNIYKKEFAAFCPINGEEIFYELILESEDEMVMVESINETIEHMEDVVCSDLGAALVGYHEDVADFLYQELGYKQTLSAVHHGVHIKTVRG